MLDAMREAVRKNLERKQRLGHYAVVWQDGKVLHIGGEPLRGSTRPNA
jgi:hypothetical protein